MVKFIETKEFKELNIGLALDEGFLMIDHQNMLNIKDRDHLTTKK